MNANNSKVTLTQTKTGAANPRPSVGVEPLVSHTCEHCGSRLQETYPPPEDWSLSRFCLKLFSWRILLIKHDPEYSCIECMADEQQARESEQFNDALSWVISEEIQKGNLIPREQF